MPCNKMPLVPLCESRLVLRLVSLPMPMATAVGEGERVLGRGERRVWLCE